MTTEQTYFGMVRHLGLSRRQRLVRQRWVLVGVGAVTAVAIAALGQFSDRERVAEREQAANVAVATASF